MLLSMRALLLLLPALLAPAVGPVWPGAASADPLDLADPTPRWIAVRFERSPADRPGDLDAAYGPWLPARLTPEPRAEEIRVVLAGALVERHLFRDHGPVPGSFSDLVFRFDPRSGHVLEATFTGTVVRRVGLGLLGFDAEVTLRASMTTLEAAGFAPARRVLGERVHELCRTQGEGCTLVPARAYDPESGYVNAVGTLFVDVGPVTTETFSPLGEALFFEAAPDELDALQAAAR